MKRRRQKLEMKVVAHAFNVPRELLGEDLPWWTRLEKRETR